MSQASKPKKPTRPHPKALEIQLSDCQSRFLLPALNLRAVRINLQHSLQSIIQQHQYPAPIAHWLGEALVANTLLTSIIKFSGKIVLHIKNKQGPIHLLSTKCNHQQHLSGVVQWDHSADEQALAAATLQGELVISIMQQAATQPYQSIVALAGNSISHSLEHYFMQSEQLATRIVVCNSPYGAQGFLLQAMPAATPSSSEHSALEQERLRHHALDQLDTARILKALEGNLSGYQILRELWPTEDIIHQADAAIAFKCQCDRQRMQSALINLGKAECEHILSQHQVIDIKCEFCGIKQQFSKDDIAKLWQ